MDGFISWKTLLLNGMILGGKRTILGNIQMASPNSKTLVCDSIFLTTFPWQISQVQLQASFFLD